MSRRAIIPVAAAVLIAVGVVLVVASRRGGGGACRERRDRLDAASLQHVLPGAPEPSYLTDPPTSGVHQAGRISGGGVRTEPIPKPAQVGALEGGQVLVQHRPDLPAEQRALLAALARADVVIAPALSLPAPVVATTWRLALVCDAAEIQDLERFSRKHARPAGAHG